MAAAVNLILYAGLTLLLSTAVLTVRGRPETAVSKACRAELTDLATQTALCPTCTQYFWALNQTCKGHRSRWLGMCERAKTSSLIDLANVTDKTRSVIFIQQSQTCVMRLRVLRILSRSASLCLFSS